MNRDKFITTRDKKIKSTKEKADALYNNLSQTNLSYRDSDEHFYKKMFKLLIKYSHKPKEPYSEQVAKALIECFGRKEFGDKVYEEKFTPIFNKENKEEIEKELNDLDRKSEVMGMIYARDCIGVNAFEKLSRLETSIHAKYIKIYDYYKLDRFGKELYEQRQVFNN